MDQVWFAGSHIDVGGGDTTTPRRDRLCNLPLLWMAEHAAAAGMRFRPGFLEELRDWSRTLTTAAQHDAMTAKWRRLHEKTGVQPAVRPIGNPARQSASATGRIWPLVETPEAIHHSLRERLNQNVTVRGEGGQETAAAYAPPNLVLDMIQPPPAPSRRLPSG